MPNPETSPTPRVESGPPDWDSLDRDILCPLCNYNLRGLIESRCPECGYRFEWPEVLDPCRRLHPYIFEHHPERPWGAFWRTALGAWRPVHFWTSLHPVQPSNWRRLILYVLIGQAVYVLGMLGFIAWSAFEKARVNAAVIPRPNPAAIAASLNAMPLGMRRFTVAPYPTTQAYIAAMCPPTTMAGILKRQISTGDLFQSLLATAVPPLMWPWAIYFCLQLFWISMRRARVDNTHVLRCALYSFDFALWAGLFLLVGTAFGLLSGAGASAPSTVSTGRGLILILGGGHGVLRLCTAYQQYLRFAHPVATVVLSLTVAGLGLMLVLGGLAITLAALGL